MCQAASLGEDGAWELRAVPSKLELERKPKRRVALSSELVCPEARELMAAPEVLCMFWSALHILIGQISLNKDASLHAHGASAL